MAKMSARALSRSRMVPQLYNAKYTRMQRKDKGVLFGGGRSKLERGFRQTRQVTGRVLRGSGFRDRHLSAVIDCRASSKWPTHRPCDLEDRLPPAQSSRAARMCCAGRKRWRE